MHKKWFDRYVPVKPLCVLQNIQEIVYLVIIYNDFDMEREVGSLVQNPKNPALWGIRNEDKLNWTYEKADGTQIPVEVGKTAGIAAGVKIHFSESVGEFK